MTMDSETAGVIEAYEELYVSPTCFVQTAENRFGPDVLDDLKAFVYETSHANDVDFDEDEDDEDDDDGDEEEDWVDAGLVFLEPHEWELALNNSGLETDPNHAQHGFPRIATTRHNLTALSQQYNLYFAAYQDKIYVYQPRRAAPQILPSPSLILHPRPSKLGQERGGVLDRRFPHQVNHLIVGNLGDSEIVLLAYDDGDVIAYYTKAIVRCIKGHSDKARSPAASPIRHTAHPKPFFHENVGRSAWGLAIHELSRLIAVGSNLHEVTVFAFALTHTNAGFKMPEVDDSPLLECGQTAFQLQRHFQSRTRTWRIILPLGRTGHNVPNLDFIDDELGEAEKVAATDVVGNVWLLDIWKIGASSIQWADPVMRDQHMIHAYKGWGVLVIPYRNFKPAKTIRESLGLPGGEVIAVTKSEESRVWLDTTCSLYYIKGYTSNPDAIFRHRRARIDYSRTHAASPQCHEDDLSDAWDSGSDTDEYDPACTAKPADTVGKLSCSLTADQEEDRWLSISPFSGKRLDLVIDDMSDETQLSRCIIPSFGETQPNVSEAQWALFNPANNRAERTRQLEFSKAKLPSHLAKNYCLLRTSTTDVELQPFDRDAPCIECKYLLTNNTRPATNMPWDLHPVYSERISMLLHVPALNLVVAGSPTGRVALITLTKTAKRLHLTRVRYGFRVDCVLPRKADEDKKLRPECTLIGVAMSPAPSRAGKGLELRPKAGPVMYRLILHYKDHTILMYDVARCADQEELLVF
ncbi:hypothetical protein N657DRAFT_639929 [Parathielavia appendiculata]|uniref:Pyridine nucleotide-disulfide oxidoreductase family protein n=1 Tax=Parathielavia appendiculata TaxID=2587402 RepID=A0AAN6UB86_9PEZI|nr:hypothetical protein N657DRAFT_639929 [Parathielavia appendiculata]